MGFPLTLDEVMEDSEVAGDPRECSLHAWVEERCRDREIKLEKAESRQHEVNRELFDKFGKVFDKIELVAKDIEHNFKQEHALLRDQIQRTTNKVVMIVALGSGAAMALTLIKTLLDIYGRVK